MEESLLEFSERYSNQSVSDIETFRNFRDNYLALLGITMIAGIIVISLYEVINYSPTGIPFPNLIFYIIPITTLLLGLWYRRKVKKLDIDYFNISSYETARIIECHGNNNYLSVIEHLENLEDEATYSGNDVFDDDVEDYISNYYSQAKSTQNLQEFFDDSLNDFLQLVVGHLEEKSQMRQVTEENSQNDTEGKITKYFANIEKWDAVAAIVFVIVVSFYIIAETYANQLPIQTNAILLLGSLVLTVIIVFKS